MHPLFFKFHIEVINYGWTRLKLKLIKTVQTESTTINNQPGSFSNSWATYPF